MKCWGGILTELIVTALSSGFMTFQILWLVAFRRTNSCK